MSNAPRSRSFDPRITTSTTSPFRKPGSTSSSMVFPWITPSTRFLPCRTPFDERCRGRARNRTNQKVTQVARLAERTVSPPPSHPLVNRPRESNAGASSFPRQRSGGSVTDRPSALSGFGLQWAWRRFYQIALSPGPLQAAASRVLNVIAACSAEGGLSRAGSSSPAEPSDEYPAKTVYRT